MTEHTSPSPSLLIKLLKMTTSSNDSEAMVAMRKANSEAAKFGGWDAIMAGKITVIGDPFASVAAPPERAANGNRPAPPARPAAPTPRAAPRPQPNLQMGQPAPYVAAGMQRARAAAPAGAPSPRRGTVKIDDLV